MTKRKLKHRAKQRLDKATELAEGTLDQKMLVKNTLNVVFRDPIDKTRLNVAAVLDEEDVYGWRVDEDTLKKTQESVDKLKGVPSIRQIHEEYVITKPDGIDLSDEEFLNASKALGEKTKVLLENLNVELAKVVPGRREALISKCSNQIFELAKKNPAFREYLNRENDRKEGNHPGRIEAVLSTLFLAGGYYLEMRKVPHFDPRTKVSTSKSQLSYFRISGSDMVSFKDQIGTFNAPVIRLDKLIYGTGKPDYLGFFDGRTGLTFMLEEAINNAASIEYERIKADFSNFLEDQDINLNKVRSLIESYTIEHEATHAYLNERFPRSCRMTSQGFLLLVKDLNIDVSAGVKANMDGVYNPVNFQELCATGAEIFNNADDFPLDLLIYLGTLSSHDNPADPYQLFCQVLPNLTVQLAPRSKYRKEAIKDIKQTRGQNLSKNIFDMIKHTFGKEDVKRIGRALYDLGLKLMKAGETGKLPRVEL
ncbi:hypothetical protein GF340_05885 [Candidatus Peregrinibacteria bacterium]|nr:hypothetical protein [Candidatus Peregrinibacteria bacterium]